MAKVIRLGLAVLAALFVAFAAVGQSRLPIVADSVTHAPLSGASVFDCKGNGLGMCNSSGRIPYVPASAYPVSVRYLGYDEKIVPEPGQDTIFLRQIFADLPEVVVESRRHKVLHVLAYVREYSTLSTYTDTVFLFREKMVDYMLPPDRKMRFRGWSHPRVLKGKSYYRFSNVHGLDSVSGESNYHFSWTDWVEIVPPVPVPSSLHGVECGADTLCGKYSPVEVWMKNNDRVGVDVNVLADTTSRRWVPSFAGFFRKGVDFENFRIRFDYGNVITDSISPVDLTGYSFNIESNGRGRDMFHFNKVGEPVFASTYAEAYVIDKEYITVKEAKRWERNSINTDDIEIFEPAGAPELQPSILALVDRVDRIDKGEVRLGVAPDSRIGHRSVIKQHFGHRVLNILKVMTGISRVRMNRSLNHQWNDFSGKQKHKNHDRQPPESAKPSGIVPDN